MNAREFYRRYGLTRDEWESLSDGGRLYVRSANRPALPHAKSARAVHAELLAIAGEDRNRATCPHHVKSGRVKIARQVRAHRSFARLP